jgi:tripartite-type tricarboxylate transporter receptor subunit TctC
MKALILAALAALGLMAAEATAQTYPSQPVRIIVPFAPGGTVDVVARLIGHKMAETLGTVVVENKPGAAGNIASEMVAKAPPDGHTILITTNGHAISPALYRKLKYDPVKDLTPVTQLNASSLVLVAGKKLAAQTLPDTVALAKAKPGSLSYGSTGVGNPLHLTMEMFKQRAGIDVLAVPYRGDAPLITALTAGEVELAVVPLPSARSHVEAGSLRPLGVANAKRNPTVPNVPTIAEQGFAGFDSASWHGLFVPAKTPHEIVQRIQQEARKALDSAEVRQRLTGFGIEPVGSPPEDFAALVRLDTEKYAEVVKNAGIPPQD